jgi:epoxyqueuosine reductase
MQYLERGRDRRANPNLLLPTAQSMLCIAIPYRRNRHDFENPVEGPRFARYLHGEDYHLKIPALLERVMESLQSRWSQALDWKICVDTSAVLERSWAALAGLGWIGKNTLLIHPIEGSFLFLGTVLLSEKTGMAPRPLPNYCGNCPTQAFSEPHLLDSKKCISYLTLEYRGQFESKIDPKTGQVGAGLGRWLAGCDVCQEVCPFNRKPMVRELSADSPSTPRRESEVELSSPRRTWKELLKESPEDYRMRVKESSLSRVKPAMARRNLAFALWESLPHFSRDQKIDLTPFISLRLKEETEESLRPIWETLLAQCAESIGSSVPNRIE